MSKPCWEKKLAELLRAQPKPTETPRRLALVGIGNELDGDDGAGVAAIRLLRSLISDQNLLLAEAGVVPENFTAPLRRFRPELVALIDAGDFGGPAGEIRLLDWREAQGFSASTHSLPLSVFAGYLEEELVCPVALIAIQPLTTGFDLGLSVEVQRAVAELAVGLRDLWVNQ